MMEDQCSHCSVRGDIDACLKTPCSNRNDWFVDALLQKQVTVTAEAVNGMQFIKDIRPVARLLTQAAVYTTCCNSILEIHPCSPSKTR
jgi:hypothetical protein